MGNLTPNKAWRGRAVYHIVLTVTSRKPLLGRLMVPEEGPTKAFVERSELGEAVVQTMMAIPDYHPEVELYAFEVMPDHLHFILHVADELPKGTGINRIVQGFWIGCRKEATDMGMDNPFEDRPYIRYLHRKGQLQQVFDYVHDNPRRLALKRSHPGLFRTQRGVEIAGRRYDAIGNICLLTAERMQTIHVRRALAQAAREGEEQPLRDYMNGCVLAAREGVVSISPFISPDEKRVLDVLLREGHEVIMLLDNGFSEYYKPTSQLIDACSKGKVLLLAPWPYQEDKNLITREECQELNQMAEEIVMGEEGEMPDTVRL